jgi:protein transport protein SEC61 subunit gamma-like protein
MNLNPLNINIKEIPAKIMYTLREYKRVIIVSKKPDAEDIVKISKVAGLGIILIGVIGFVVQIISQLIVGR